MDINAPLQDWEISRLSERMSPDEFGRFALGDLGITKVRLDQCREDAGRDCVAYMANSLMAWRDSQPQNEARQRLFNALVSAADRGLIERRSFLFLTAGEEYEQRPHERNGREWNACVRICWDIWRKCTSYTSLVVVLLIFFPALCLGRSYVAAINIPGTPSGLDEVTLNIVQMALAFDSVSTLYLAMFIGAWIFGVLVILLSIIFDCCVCCNTTLVRGQRIQERNRDKFRIALFTIVGLGVYIPPAINCFITYNELHNFDASQADIAHHLSNYVDQRTWDKVQIWFDCCGVNNYTYWYGQIHHHVVPDSCCKAYHPHCGNFSSLEQINERGCVPNVTAHVNDQIKYHTEETQTTFALAFCGLILGCFGILAWVWHKSNIKCCSRNRANQDDELIDDGNIEADPEEQQLIQNVELQDDDNDNINIDDPIINIENNNVNNDGDVNVEINRTIEMADVLDVHQTNAEDDDDQLLE